ncbi:cytochrome b/b6 domain-containing protein [Oricola nitratireducens]|uniref:cytochrome b/b6 domain-containing protein n=1 Tax=Oricola nitratireducens TaxID=2775868 RepID=UPI001AED8AD9|nr:cytochrome b/b6 domain-containing protein [Oricola nitratireducens]
MATTTTHDTQEHGMAAADAARASVKVWDPFVRLFHWSLVAVVATAALTGFFAGASWLQVHVWAGTAMAALVVARVVWGFTGGSYARFSAFIRGPRQVISHLRGIVDGTEGRHIGHNPLGALMIVALLATAALLALTGAVALGGMFKFGPFAFLADFASGRLARELHSLLAWGLVLLVALHVAGAVFEGWRTRDNLMRAMVTGAKQRRPGDYPAPRLAARPMLGLAVGVVFLGGGAASVSTLASRPPLGVPTAPLDAVYADECGACHTAYHPSLLPAASWRALFANLGDHFGEDATLPPETVAKLEAYVTANAAEDFDTLPANAFRRTAADAPYQITATRFWKWMHAGISDAVFKSPAVGARGNCAACHRDAATGRFDPRRIDIPQEITR